MAQRASLIAIVVAIGLSLIGPSSSQAAGFTLSASCSPASGTFTVREDSTFGFSLGYSNGAPVPVTFTATMKENPVFGPEHVFDTATVGPGLGVSHQFETALWLRDPGPGTYHIVIGITQSLPVSTVFAGCDFTLVLTTRKPAVTEAPQVTGSARAGQPLTCSAGTWDRVVDSTSYRWLDDAGAQLGSGPTFVPGADLVGKTVKCEVTARNSGGSATAASAPRRILQALPVNTSPPAISGSPNVGSALSCSPGSWSGIVDSISYRWLDYSGAQRGTGATYVPGGDLVGHTLTCEVTAANSDGSVSVASAPSATILEALPVNTALPAITGSSNVGDFLTCSSGDWMPDPTVVATRYHFVWTRRPNAALGETGPPIVLKDHTEGPSTLDPTTPLVSVYTPVAADFDHFVWCEVTAINAGGSSTPVHASVKILSAGSGARTLTLAGARLRTPARVSLRTTRLLRLPAVASKPGLLTVALRRGATVARTSRRMRRAGDAVLSIRLPKHLSPGRYALVASYLQPGTRRASTHTTTLTVVR